MCVCSDDILNREEQAKNKRAKSDTSAPEQSPEQTLLMQQRLWKKLKSIDSNDRICRVLESFREELVLQNKYFPAETANSNNLVISIVESKSEGMTKNQQYFHVSRLPDSSDVPSDDEILIEI